MAKYLILGMPLCFGNSAQIKVIKEYDELIHKQKKLKNELKGFIKNSKEYVESDSYAQLLVVKKQIKNIKKHKITISCQHLTTGRNA